MARIVTLVNRRARRLVNEASSPLLAALRAHRTGMCLVETRTLADLDEAARGIARDVPDAVVLAGGDGSYMAGVTAQARAFGDAPLPPLALVPGGTASTVARNWGFAGGGLLATGWGAATRYAERLLDAIAAGRATARPRPSLRVADDATSRIGFIVGAGLVARFFEVYDDEGARGYRGAASIVARIFAGSFTGGRLAGQVLAPQECMIEVDSVPASFDRVSLVCAGVVRDLGLGMRLLYRAGEMTDRFHVVASALDRSRVDGLLGTVAGDDTLMCVSADPDGEPLAARLRDFAGLD